MTEPNCPCDAFVHPPPVEIDAGLTVIGRQQAGFAQYRRAMLAALPTHPALGQWRARSDQDLGVMLLEMWAYVCDVVSFYDESIAHESYLRTARLDASVRKLVGLLGYRPRPAVAARVRLAIQAEGRRPVSLPAGTPLRSSASGSEPPQVFELDADTTVHPLCNGWSLAPTRPTAVPAGATQLLLEARTARVTVGDHLLVQSGAVLAGGVFTATSVDRRAEVTVGLDGALSSAVPVATARLLRPGATTPLWTGPLDPQTIADNTTSLVLAGVVNQIRPGGRIIANGKNGAVAFSVTTVIQGTRRLVAGTSTTPAVQVPVTVLTISPGWVATTLGTDPGAVTVEYGMQDVGTITTPVDSRIAPGAPLRLLPPLEAPPDHTKPVNFLVADVDGTAAELAGQVAFDTGSLTPSQGGGLTIALDPPAIVYGNLAAASRGETVPSEVLGVGDASVANQSFTLRKKPLTYLSVSGGSDPTGVRSTLTVWVRDVRWTEVATFFGVPPDASVYVVRRDDAGDATVVFGDGVRGARLPAGGPVVARYRFGAGSAVPPPGGISQMAKPVKGITAVRSPVPAAGGSDPEAADRVRTYAPRSALLFGRAVSIQDMEALAAGQPGVRAVAARWAWDADRQLPTVHVWYIGPDSLAAPMTAALRGATAPSTPITARPATPVDRTLVVDLRVHRDHVPAVVKDEVVATLTAPVTGLLSAERIGVATALFRSVLLAEVLAVTGVTRVTGLIWDGSGFTDYGYLPGEGAWFRVELEVNPTEDQDV